MLQRLFTPKVLLHPRHGLNLLLVQVMYSQDNLLKNCTLLQDVYLDLHVWRTCLWLLSAHASWLEFILHVMIHASAVGVPCLMTAALFHSEYYYKFIIINLYCLKVLNFTVLIENFLNLLCHLFFFVLCL